MRLIDAELLTTNIAQDALQDAYDNVRRWIYEILNGGEDGDSE